MKRSIWSDDCPHRVYRMTRKVAAPKQLGPFVLAVANGFSRSRTRQAASSLAEHVLGSNPMKLDAKDKRRSTIAARAFRQMANHIVDKLIAPKLDRKLHLYWTRNRGWVDHDSDDSEGDFSDDSDSDSDSDSSNSGDDSDASGGDSSSGNGDNTDNDAPKESDAEKQTANGPHPPTPTGEDAVLDYHEWTRIKVWVAWSNLSLGTNEMDMTIPALDVGEVVSTLETLAKRIVEKCPHWYESCKAEASPQIRFRSWNDV